MFLISITGITTELRAFWRWPVVSKSGRAVNVLPIAATYNARHNRDNLMMRLISAMALNLVSADINDTEFGLALVARDSCNSLVLRTRLLGTSSYEILVP